MHGEIAYRQLVLSDKSGDERLRVPLLTPVNDLLGGDANRTEYVIYLSSRYSDLFPPESVPDAMTHAGLFTQALGAAAEGRFDARLAPFLERITFDADGTVADVSDLLALGAWSLLEGIRRQPLKVRTCLTCKRNWVASPGEKSRYCQRMAPGHPSKDCRTLAYERRVAGDRAYRDYRREYKRLTERHNRGTLQTYDLYRWRDENDATNWLPFEQW